MLERLIHEPLAREIGQPLLTLTSLNKIDWILIDWYVQRTCKALEASCILDFTVSISTNIFIDCAVFSSTYKMLLLLITGIINLCHKEK